MVATLGEPRSAQGGSPPSHADEDVVERVSAPKETVCCRDPQCKSPIPCFRPRCDYPGAGS